MYKTFLAIIFSTIIPINISFAQEPSIISKDEANWVFSMYLDQWKQNATKARDAGAAGYETNGANEHTLIINTPPAIMMITPTYSQDNFTAPWKVSLRLIPHKNLSDLWRNSSDVDLKKMVASTYSQMMPEFTVFTSYTISDEIVFQDIQILKQGYDMIADEMAAQHNGCFKECIIRASQTDSVRDGEDQSFFDEQNKLVKCSQPLPEFTLGVNSKPTQSEVISLCSCIWESFPVDGWERPTSGKIRNGEDPGWRGKALLSRFANSLKNCGGMGL